MLPIYRQVLTVGTLVRIIITTCDMAARRASTSQRVVLSRVFPAGGRHGLRGEKRVIYNTGGVLVVCDVGGASMTSPLVAPVVVAVVCTPSMASLEELNSSHSKIILLAARTIHDNNSCWFDLPAYCCY